MKSVLDALWRVIPHVGDASAYVVSPLFCNPPGLTSSMLRAVWGVNRTHENWTGIQVFLLCSYCFPLGGIRITHLVLSVTGGRYG